jgi:hypothetical protein
MMDGSLIVPVCQVERTAKHNSNESSSKVLNLTKARHYSTERGQKVAKRDITKSRRKAKYSSFRTSVETLKQPMVEAYQPA